MTDLQGDADDDLRDPTPTPGGRIPAVEALFQPARNTALPPAIRKKARTLSRRSVRRIVSRPCRPHVLVTELEAGDTVAGRYTIEREVGRGGMATVYLARDAKFDQPVAIKTTVASGDTIAEFEARFQLEARVSYLLGQSPGIIRALDWGKLPGGNSLYLVLDFVKGATPLDLRSSTIAKATQKLIEAATLVAVAHRQEIVHRDLKPGNFLVSDQGKLHLSDFGVAVRLGQAADKELSTRLTRTGALIGTPLFMAPEQLDDPREVNLAADVYSLGVMLYYALLGRYPYQGETPVEFLTAQLKTRYGLAPPPERPRQQLPEIAPRLDTLCMASIAADPDERPQDASAFLRELRGGAVERPPRRSLEEMRTTLGLDSDGLTSLETLRTARERVGAERFRGLIGQTPVLVVRHERAIDGKRYYEGRVAPLLQKTSERPTGVVTLGRTEENDVTLRLVSISSRHLRFVASKSGWSVVDEGSINGSTVNDEPLRPLEARSLRDGDHLRIAQHVTLQFVAGAGLERLLEIQPPTTM